MTLSRESGRHGLRASLGVRDIFDRAPADPGGDSVLQPLSPQDGRSVRARCLLAPLRLFCPQATHCRFAPTAVPLRGHWDRACVLSRPRPCRELRGHRLELRELADRPDAMACHAVFVGAADRRRLEAALRRQRAASALVISDDPDAPADSTAIVLSRVGQKIVIDVNLGPLRQAGLQLSSKLLRLARVVRQ